MKRDLATPLAPTFTDPVKKKKKKKKYVSHSVLTALPKKKGKQTRLNPPKGTWRDGDDDTSNSPKTYKKNAKVYPVYTNWHKENIKPIR